MRGARFLLTLAAASAVAACGTGSSPATSPSVARTSGPASSGPASSSPASPGTPSGSASPAADSCLLKARSLTRAERAGQVLMLGHGASTPVGPQTTALLQRNRIGSVLLLENTSIGVDGVRDLTDKLRDAATQPTGVDLAIAADQEGGLVQRLQGEGFSTIPSAREQAKFSDDDLAERAGTWGRQLRKAGVDLDFAPVADVVPRAYRASNEPISQLDRGFGTDAGTVADKVTAVVEGMDEAGVATAVKHFPGIGAVRGNTDFSAGVKDTTTTRHDADLAGFAAGVEAGADMVMVSTVTYTRIDPKRQAVFSPTVMSMIRTDLGFDGVIVSDDLGAARAVARLAPEERAVRFLRAGGDLVINADPALMDDMAAGVRDEMAADPDFEKAVTGHAARVLQLKADRGLGSCG